MSGFYHNNPYSPPRSPLSPLYPPNANPAIRFANNRLSTYSDVSIHDLSDFCEDDLDDYLPQESTEHLVPNAPLNKLYGGILDSQQWDFAKAPKNVDYDLGEWSKTSAMILSDPPKRKYLLDQTAPVDEPQPPKMEEPAPVYSEKPKQVEVDMSQAPPHAISFAQPDFFSREKQVIYGDEGEKPSSFYKKRRTLILVSSALFVVLAIVLIVLGATGQFTPSKRVVDQTNGGSKAMSQHEETKQVEEQSADVMPAQWAPTEWSADVDPAFNIDLPSAPSFTPALPDTPDMPSIPQTPPTPPPPASTPASTFSLSGEGEGTYYSPGVGLGACGAMNSDVELVAALNIPQFGDYINPANSPACGACINITGPKGSVKVKIVDKCPGCKHGDIDLSPAAFEQVADLATGRIKITWGPC